MKTAVIYSSLTGNTRKVAEAIHRIMPDGSGLYSVKDAPGPADFDFLALGFWVDRGDPDAAMKACMQRLKGVKVGLFGTLGAWPDSDHAKESMARAVDMVQGCEVLGTFLCMGKVDPRILAAIAKMPAAQEAHAMTEERRARIEEAKKHPDDTDCAAAQRVFAAMIRKLQGTQE